MRKTLRTLVLSIVFAVGLMGYVLADVAPGPIYAMAIGIPLLIIAVAVIIIAIVVKIVRRNRGEKK